MSKNFTIEPYIIENCKQGDRKSQKEVYDLFAPNVYHFCLSNCISKSAAEAAMAEGFIKFYSTIQYYTHDKPFNTWAMEIFRLQVESINPNSNPLIVDTPWKTNQFIVLKARLKGAFARLM